MLSKLPPGHVGGRSETNPAANADSTGLSAAAEADGAGRLTRDAVQVANPQKLIWTRVLQLESLGEAIIALVRLLGLGFFITLPGAWAASIESAGRRYAIVIGSAVVFMAVTHFQLSNRCVSGSEDTDDWGRPVFICDKYVPTHAPFVPERTMAVGALTFVGAGLFIARERLSQFKRRLDDSERRRMDCDQENGGDD